MNFEVERLTKEQWAPLSENAHIVAFNEKKAVEGERIDFALLVKRDGKLTGYCTCKEYDAKSLYWQYGGAFPGTKETSVSLPAYMRLVWWSKQNYDRVYTLIENSNLVMLKMAMKVGFRITGVRNHHGKIYLEHSLEFEK